MKFLKLLSGVGAACLALATIAPAAAQTAPSLNSWQAGPDAQGANTYVGRIESPSRNARVSSGSNLLVSGWVVDTTALGWAGIDAVEVWSGAKDKGGKKLADGMVGLPRADVADALGANFANSGFNAVVPGSALAGMTGAQTLYVYVHTPSKGTHYRTAGINATAGPQLAFPTDPIVVITRPTAEAIFSQKQKNNKFSFLGYALDRNPVTDANTQSLGPCGCGIASVTLYLDGPRGVGTNLGTAGISEVFVNNAGGRGPTVDYGTTPQPFPNFSYATGSYGSQFNLGGFSLAFNPALFDAEMFHTVYAYARSSTTGKESVATARFFIKGGERILTP